MSKQTTQTNITQDVQNTSNVENIPNNTESPYNTPLQYQGNVTITTTFGKTKKIIKTHNAGDTNLFNLIAKFLAKNKIQSADLPSFIKILDADGKIPISNSLICYVQLGVASNSSDEDINSVIYYTTLESIHLPSKSVNDVDTFMEQDVQLGLYDANGNILANLTTSGTLVANTLLGATSLIQWELCVNNYTPTQTT